MNSNPFDPWYASQLTKDGSRTHDPDHWEFFTLSYDQGATEDAKEERTTPNDIDKWIEQIVHPPSEMCRAMADKIDS